MQVNIDLITIIFLHNFFIRRTCNTQEGSLECGNKQRMVFHMAYQLP